MDRHIPHVLDVFTSSPGARRRMRDDMVSKEKAELQKNPGSDSAVSVGSSDDEEEEGEDQRNISKYFDYLNENEFDDGSSQRRKKKKKHTALKENNNKLTDVFIKDKDNVVTNNDKNNKQLDGGKRDRPSRKGEYEKDIRHIERHLSMKKTIRKKIMRDLQQAFVEDPKDLQQDPKGMTKEKKNNIDINNLTFSKNRLSKSEHNFLDMLKEDHTKERKGLRALMDFRKEKPTPNSAASIHDTKASSNESKQQVKEENDTGIKNKTQPSREEEETIKSEGKIRDDDSGHGSPTREPRDNFAKRSKSKDDLLDMVEGKDAASKKQSFWKRITGKGKSKR